MPTWGELLNEINTAHGAGDSNIRDSILEKYLKKLSLKTQRNLILYSTAWAQTKNNPVGLTSIVNDDLHGLMEVIHGLKGEKLDIILHSPGGSPTATEALVKYLRTKFNDIRIIIPHAAMSAATMLACSANKIVMGKHSFIGPIDPQIFLLTQYGATFVPAQSIKDQFKIAEEKCKKPENSTFWYQILSQFTPAILVQCDNAIKLSEELVSQWLQKYMFENNSDSIIIAKSISEHLSDHNKFRDHSRHIDCKDAKKLGLIVENLEDDQELQDLVLSIHHISTIIFDSTNTIKIISNQLGKSFVKSSPNTPSQ